MDSVIIMWPSCGAIDTMKNSKQLEKHFKGVANHRRLDILFLVNRNPGITVDGISKGLRCNFKTISGHAAKLVQAGLLDKQYQGKAVAHVVSPYGKKLLLFIKTF